MIDIAELRKRLIIKRDGRSLRIVAAESGISTATLSRIERGMGNVHLATVQRLLAWIGDDMEENEEVSLRRQKESHVSGQALNETVKPIPAPRQETIRVRVAPDCVACVIFEGPLTRAAIEKLIANLELTRDVFPE